MIDFLKKSGGGEEGEPIEHPMLTRAIEKAQKRVEQYNFGIRKHLLEYDDVANRQREVIYERRLQALSGVDLGEEVAEMIRSVTEYVLEPAFPDDTDSEEWNLEQARVILGEMSGVAFDLGPLAGKHSDPAEVRRAAASLVLDYYGKKKEKLGPELTSELEKWSVLRAIDSMWRDHLYAVDHLKSGIGLRAYGQRDPLVEFKKEAFGLFEELLDDVDRLAVRQVLSLWPRPAGTVQGEQPAGRAYQPGVTAPGAPQGTAPGGAPAGRATVTRKQPKTGRNEPCPCGSGKKYKHCCGS
jgi:preprotein translocase subunit SecA